MSQEKKSSQSRDEIDALIFDLLSLHTKDVSVDISVFLDLLKHSFSLDLMAKKRVIDSVPTLNQFQFDELQKIFLSERDQFKEIAKENPEDMKKLIVKQQKERTQLADLYKTQKQNQSQKKKDDDKINDIKSNLGL